MTWTVATGVGDCGGGCGAGAGVAIPPACSSIPPGIAAAGFADEAGTLARKARQAERRGDDLEAFLLYTRAAGLRPSEPKYRLQAERLRPRAAVSLAALGKTSQALALEPDNSYLRDRLDGPKAEDFDSPTEAEIRDAEQPAEPAELRPHPARRDLDLRGDPKSVWERLMRAYGLEAVFDPEYKPGSAVRLRLEQVEFRQAARALMTLTETFLVPVHQRVGLVAKDTQQKRAELEPMMAALLAIPTVMTVEEANEIGRGVQQALDIRRLAVDGTRRQVLVRDTVTKVRLARALYEDLSRRRGEVNIEFELLSVSRSALTDFGLTLPTGFPVTYLGTYWNSPPTPVAAGSAPLLGFGSGDTLLGVAIGGANLQASFRRSDAQLLSRFWLRATDGLAASLHIGDKFPIINATFSPIVITDQIRDLDRRGQLLQPFPSFTFEDLGLVLKVTPRVHDSREVSLAIEAEFRLLTGESVNGVPIMSNRKFNSGVRLKEGESSLLAGMLTAQWSRTWTGLAGLSHIPFFGQLLRKNTWQNDENELLLVVTPRLTGLPPAEQFFSRTYHWGAEARPAPSL